MNAYLLNFILPFSFSLLVTALIIPKWIKLCAKWKLFDRPDSRKHHVAVIPSLGGIAIFAGINISFFISSAADSFVNDSILRYVLGSCFILFFTGFFDDLMEISAKRKLVIQTIAALFVAYGGLRLKTLHGFLGVQELPILAQYGITVFVILFLVNAYNFIDGIDGLAATIGLIIFTLFAVLFYMKQEMVYTTLCLCVIGSLTAFIFFNFEPAKIFMGDTGSLVIGFLLACCSIKLLAVAAAGTATAYSPLLIVAALFILIFDLSRVVFIRLANGISPFTADRSHLHHMVCRQEFGHRGATIILALFNLLFIGMVFFFNQLSIAGFFILCFCLAVILINSKVLGVVAIIRNKVKGAPVKKVEVNPF